MTMLFLALLMVKIVIFGYVTLVHGEK